VGGGGPAPPDLQPIIDWVESQTVMLMKEHPLAQMFPGWFPPCENHSLLWDLFL